MGDGLPFVDLGTGRVPVTVAGGDGHTCALFTTKRVACWGANWGGELGTGTFSPTVQPTPLGDALVLADFGGNVETVYAGDAFTCVLLDAASGSVVKCVVRLLGAAPPPGGTYELTRAAWAGTGRGRRGGAGCGHDEAVGLGRFGHGHRAPARAPRDGAHVEPVRDAVARAHAQAHSPDEEAHEGADGKAHAGAHGKAHEAPDQGADGKAHALAHGAALADAHGAAHAQADGGSPTPGRMCDVRRHVPDAVLRARDQVQGAQVRGRDEGL